MAKSKFQITSSTAIKKRNTKIFLWGDTGTRKTEFALRHLPDCLIIDAEGNADACVGMDDVPEFMHIEEKDAYKVAEIIEEVSAGLIKFPDGRPVQTVIIDSVTVLYAVRQDAGAIRALERVKRYKKTATDDDATLTPMDWGIIKRPLKRINGAINGAKIPFVVLISREKPLMKEVKTGGRTEMIQDGWMFDAMKGSDYEANLAFHFQKRSAAWTATVTKVQGALSKYFPMGKVFKELDGTELLAYAETLDVNRVAGATELEAAQASAERDNTERKEAVKTAAPKVTVVEGGKPLADVFAWITQNMGLDEKQARAKLIELKITKYNPADYDKVIKKLTKSLAAVANA